MTDERPPAEPGKRHLFDNPRNTRRVIWALVVACVVTFFTDPLVHRHVDHPWEALFGFYGLSGFVACVLLVRKETYYDD